MKKQSVFLLIFIVMSLQFAQSESIDFSVGGGVTVYLVPSISFYNYETTISNPASVTANDYLDLLFGFAVTAPIVVTYNLNNGWGIGGTFELGYSFQAGPHVYLRNPPPNYVPADTAHFFHAFYGVFNFMARTPKLKYDFRIMMEIGLILRGGGMFGWNRNYVYTYSLGAGTTSIRGLCYAGPNMFIGLQKELAPSLVIMPGFRFSAEFAGYYDTYPNAIYREFYVQINFGFEFRIMWNKNFALSSSGGGGSDKTRPSNKKPKKNKDNDGDKKNGGNEDFK